MINRFARVQRLGTAVIGARRVQPFSVDLPNLSANQLGKIQMTDDKLRNQHKVLESQLSEEERDISRRKRMIYRSKQRGWLEADILLGSWAVENVPHLTSEELDEYEVLLAEETIDIYNYVSGKDPLPQHLQNLGLMKKIQEYAQKSKIQNPQQYENIKKGANLT